MAELGVQTLQFVASSLFGDTGFTDRQPDHFQEIGPPSVALAKDGSGGRNYTCLKKFMRLLSVL